MTFLEGDGAALFGELFGGDYVAAILYRETDTYDDEGDLSRAEGGTECRVQIDRTTEAMRLAEGYTSTDVAVYVLARPAGLAVIDLLDTGCEIEIYGDGPHAGERYKIGGPVERDPAGAYWLGRGILVARNDPAPLPDLSNLAPPILQTWYAADFADQIAPGVEIDGNDLLVYRDAVVNGSVTLAGAGTYRLRCDVELLPGFVIDCMVPADGDGTLRARLLAAEPAYEVTMTLGTSFRIYANGAPRGARLANIRVDLLDVSAWA